MSLLQSKLVTGRIEKPPKLMIWGPPAVGKSSFAAEAPKALFIEAEDRTAHLDIERVPVKTWAEVEELLAELVTTEHEYKTIVFDTVDAIESLLLTAIAEEAGCESHEDIGGGFAKFRVPMKKKWRRFIKAMDRLTHKGIQVVLLAHARVKQYQPPDGEAYDRFVIAMDAAGSELLIENVDLVGYAKFQTFIKAGKSGTKGKATSSGKRKLQFKFHPAYPTKQGVPCADEVDLSWEAFVGGLDAASKE